MEFLIKLKNFIFTKHFLKQAGYIALIYVVIVGGTILYLDAMTNHGQKIEVPNLVGKNIRSIGGIIEEKGLVYEVLDSIYEPNKPEGTILKQDPGPTSSTRVHVKEGRIIKLSVSKRTDMVEMPYLVERSFRYAESVLKNRGLKYSVSYEATTEADGAVLDQRYKGKFIKEKTKIPRGAVIQLVVGRNSGGEPVQIPNLVGLTINEVQERLSSIPNVTLFISCEGCVTAADSAAVRVYSQSPEFIEGQLSPAGTTVSVQMKKDLE